VQTYRGCDATKPELLQQDHGVIHTSDIPPNLKPGENPAKEPIHVVAVGSEILAATSRVDYGKHYEVSHTVRILNVGMVVEDHKHLIETYFQEATHDVRG
jgi:hypothetical protein